MSADVNINGEVFASPLDALVADGQRMVGQPVDFQSNLWPFDVKAGQEFTLGFEVGLDIVVRVDAPGKGTIVVVRETPRAVDWDADGNPIRWHTDAPEAGTETKA